MPCWARVAPLIWLMLHPLLAVVGKVMKFYWIRVWNTETQDSMQNFGANFEHFWVANWPQVTNKCYNIDVRILINKCWNINWPPRVANWPPKFDGILFPTLWPMQGHKVQHLLILGADWFQLLHQWECWVWFEHGPWILV